jgi:uncharacterized repeat protein (TIGR01451 family)
VAGLAALGTVAAQQPGGVPPPTPPVVRPYGDWTPTAPPAGYLPSQPGGTRPLGGSYLPPPTGSNAPVPYPSSANAPLSYPPPGGTPANRPNLAPPAPAAGGIKPAGAFDVPPPAMDFPPAGARPAAPPAPALPTTPSKPLPPPTVSIDSVPDSKFPPAAPITAPPAVSSPPVATPPSPAAPPAPIPAVPAPPAALPPAPSGAIPPPPARVGAPPALPSTPIVPPSPAGTGAAPKPFPVPAAPTAGVGSVLPGKVSQSVSVEAICPASVVYNAEFRYELIVRNGGNVAVQGVRVEDEVPPGARYVGSDPPAELNGDKLVWALGSMDAHTDKRITVRVRPSEEGELRSRATVFYSGSVEAKTRVTRPRVAVSATCGEVCRVGDDAVFQVKVTNSGTGPAQKMVLRAEMSDGLFYPQDPKLRNLETTLAALPAGETKTLTLPLNAVKAGLNACQFIVTAEGSPETTAKAQVNVVEPLLQITQSGPSKCLVRAEPTYEVTLTNPGTAATDAITLHAVLPDGFDYVQASDAGAFSATNRAISWKLPALPAGGTKTVAVKLRAAAAGDVVLRTVAVATPEQPIAQAGAGLRPTGRTLEAKGETQIKSEGVAAVRFEVKDLEDPVEVGKEAVYEIRVTNQGTGACTNVQLMAAVAEGATYSGANGPTAVKAQGQTLVFDPITTLPVKGEMVYTVRVKGNVPGDLRFRVQLTCDQVRTPVVKEESTSFYKQ